MKKIAITGGYGNLGSWLAEYFSGQGHHVIVVAKRKRPILDHISHNFVRCDVTDQKNCLDVFGNQRFDVIIHTASVSTGDFKESAEVNALGTRNILEAVKNNLPGHFIYLSTFQVYGQYSGLITENTPLKTSNDYGNTHLFSEQYLKQFRESHQLNYTIIRLTNSYGCPKDIQSSQWSLVLNDLALSAFEQEKITLKTNGKAPRDFIWMGDVCVVFGKLVETGALNDVFNLSGQHTYKMIEIARFVRDAYLEVFDKELVIEVNDEDKSEYSEVLEVSSQKLRGIIAVENHERFKEEAVRIFDFLEKMSQHR